MSERKFNVYSLPVFITVLGKCNKIFLLKVIKNVKAKK